MGLPYCTGQSFAVALSEGLFEPPVTTPGAFPQERASQAFTRAEAAAPRRSTPAGGAQPAMRRHRAFGEAPCIEERAARIQSTGGEMKTMRATHLLKTYRDVVARLQNGVAGPTADSASSDFLDLAQRVEHQELARLSATRLADRAKRLQLALTRMAGGGQ